MLATIEIEPAVTATASLIGLHGLGADGHDLEAIMSQLPTSNKLRLVLPHAPIRPVSLNGGLAMRAWYDLYGLALGTREDNKGLQTAANWIGQLIQREVEKGVPTQRIFLAGFSQGGALALYTGLRYSESLGGLIVLSGYLPLAKDLITQASPANRTTAIFMAHGEKDSIVSTAVFEFSLNRLQALGYSVQPHCYPMAHSICLQEIRDVAAWLDGRLAAP